MKTIRIGTRGSDLARWQASHVSDLLSRGETDLRMETLVISTMGDRILDVPLARIGGKGLFTKEIEEALLDRRIDLAVHSLKDLPTELPDGLALGAVVSAADPHDVLVSPGGVGLQELPPSARIGTSSARRRAQLRRARPDLVILDLRGNVPTRLRKLEQGEYDAIVLARAGLERLGLLDERARVLPAGEMLPAPGQGALGIEVRRGDAESAEVVAKLEDPWGRARTDAERAFLHALGGGCQVPVGALAERVGGDAGRLLLHGMVADLEGSRILIGEESGAVEAAGRIGSNLASRLIARGAAEILDAIRLRGDAG